MDLFLPSICLLMAFKNFWNFIQLLLINSIGPVSQHNLQQDNKGNELKLTKGDIFLHREFTYLHIKFNSYERFSRLFTRFMCCIKQLPRAQWTTFSAYLILILIRENCFLHFIYTHNVSSFCCLFGFGRTFFYSFFIFSIVVFAFWFFCAFLNSQTCFYVE